MLNLEQVRVNFKRNYRKKGQHPIENRNNLMHSKVFQIIVIFINILSSIFFLRRRLFTNAIKCEMTKISCIYVISFPQKGGYSI